VALGVDALLTNTTGDYNTALANSTLQLNTTGADNVAIGHATLNKNTTGNNSTGIGYSALNSNTTGNNNTAVGFTALGSVTTGIFNTAIGPGTGNAITTGSYNTIIGNYAGTTTLASNIILADGAGNVRLFSDANGLIGINQAVGSVPGGQLDIHTTQTYALVLNGLTTNNAYTAFSNNSVGKWRIGNTYNAGANTFDIFNLGTSSSALSFDSTSNAATFTSIGFLSAITTNATAYSPSNLSSINGIIINNLSPGGFSNIVLNAIDASGAANCNAAISVLSESSGTRNSSLTFATREHSTGNTTERLRISSLGNVLIGTTTDNLEKLQVNGSVSIIGSTGGFKTSINSSLSMQLNNATANDFQLNGAGPIRIINQAYNSVLFQVTNGGTATFVSLAGTGSRAVLADASGVLSAPVSDISVKENINTIGYGLNEILKMNPVWFNYNDEYKNYGEGRQNGNIAQEMETIIPEAVFTTPTTGKMGINYDQLHAVYIKAIQELKAEIDALKNN
jgi:hypothetical protein